jgi:hypothetical protein
MRQMLFFGILFSVSVFLFSYKANKTNESCAEKKMENSPRKYRGIDACSGNFEVTTPKGWERLDTMEEEMEITYLLSPLKGVSDDFRENINIVSEEIGDMPLEEYLTLSKTNMKKMLINFNEIETSDQTISGLPGSAMRYEHEYSGIPLDVKAYVVIKDGVAYLINCTVPRGKLGDWMKPINEVVESFKIN